MPAALTLLSIHSSLSWGPQACDTLASPLFFPSHVNRRNKEGFPLTWHFRLRLWRSCCFLHVNQQHWGMITSWCSECLCLTVLTFLHLAKDTVNISGRKIFQWVKEAANTVTDAYNIDCIVYNFFNNTHLLYLSQENGSKLWIIWITSLVQFYVCKSENAGLRLSGLSSSWLYVYWVILVFTVESYISLFTGWTSAPDISILPLFTTQVKDSFNFDFTIIIIFIGLVSRQLSILVDEEGVMVL